jgi:hypothetical protein
MRLASFSCLLLGLTTSVAAAQITEVRPGVRIRFSAPGVVDGRFTATVLSRTADTIEVGAPEVASLRVPVSRITALEVSRGNSRAAGALNGIAWGAPLGLAFGLATTSVVDTCTECWRDTNKPTKTVWVLSGLIDGALIGGLIGSAIGRERWDWVDLPQRSSFRILDGRPTIAIALRF